jgi:hypothetical protein
VCTILQYISDDDAALCCEGLGSDSDQGFGKADGSHHTHRDHVANISEASSKGNGQYDGSHPSNIAWIGIDHNNPCYAVGRDALCPELWGAYTRYQLFHNMGLPLEDSGYNGAWIKMASKRKLQPRDWASHGGPREQQVLQTTIVPAPCAGTMVLQPRVAYLHGRPSVLPCKGRLFATGQSQRSHKAVLRSGVRPMHPIVVQGKEPLSQTQQREPH